MAQNYRVLLKSVRGNLKGVLSGLRQFLTTETPL